VIPPELVNQTLKQKMEADQTPNLYEALFGSKSNQEAPDDRQS